AVEVSDRDGARGATDVVGTGGYEEAVAGPEANAHAADVLAFTGLGIASGEKIHRGQVENTGPPEVPQHDAFGGVAPAGKEVGEPEGAGPVAAQHPDAVAGRDDVEAAVAGEVPQGDAVQVRDGAVQAGGDGALEGAVAVARQHAHVGTDRNDVGVAVAVEVADGDEQVGEGIDRVCDRVLEGAVAVARQDGHAMKVDVDHRQIEDAVAPEVARGHRIRGGR